MTADKRSNRLCTRILTAGIVLLPAAGTTFAKPGDLDPAFGAHGRVIVDIADDADIAANVLQQPDGKLLVGRGNQATDDDFSVLRFNADGSPDTSFDGDGRTSLDVPGIKGTTQVILLQADGKIVAAGAAHDPAQPLARDFALARYNEDGSVDTTFGVGGVAIHDLARWDELTDIVQQADGRLVAGGATQGGTSSSLDMAFIRFDANGTLDRSFGSNGVVVINFHGSNGYDSVTSLVQQHDGKLIASGIAPPSNGYSNSDMAVLRLLPDGQPDVTFDGDGLVTVRVFDPQGRGAGNLAQASAVAAERDGGVILAGNGNYNVWDYGMGVPGLARVNADGSLDTTFGERGIAWLDSFFYVNGMVIDANGLIYLAGAYGAACVARVTPTGELDEAFGVGGIATIDVGDGDHAYYSDYSEHASLIRQADGKIVTVSSAKLSYNDPGSERLVVARLLVSGEGGPGLVGLYGALSAYENVTIKVRVRRSGGSSGIVSVDYSTADGSATSGADYTGTRGTLTWSDGDTTDKIVEISIAADSIEEPIEDFLVELANPSGGASLSASQIRVQIRPPAASPTPMSTIPAQSVERSGGGGAIDWISLACLLAILTVIRRRSSGPVPLRV